MKKVNLLELMNFETVQIMNTTKQKILKGGCGNDKYHKYCKCDKDNGDDDDNTCGGPDDFIPPPGT